MGSYFCRYTHTHLYMYILINSLVLICIFYSGLQPFLTIHKMISFSIWSRRLREITYNPRRCVCFNGPILLDLYMFIELHIHILISFMLSLINLNYAVYIILKCVVDPLRVWVWGECCFESCPNRNIVLAYI